MQTALCTASGRAALVGGLATVGDRPLTWARTADLVVVPGSDHPEQFVAPDRALTAVLRVIRGAHDAGAVVASQCSGAFALAAAGLLDGRRATTHWSLAPALAAAFPTVDLDPDDLFVRSDQVWTSAGTAAGIDLSLALVREYLGPVAAAETSRRLVAAPYRRGDQAQFVDRPIPPDTQAETILSQAGAVVDAEGSAWTMTELARRLHISERTLSRRFSQEAGTTVHRWLTGRRIEEARRLLAGSDLPVAGVGARCGYASAVTFRQRFRAEVGMSPAEYRAAHRR